MIGISARFNSRTILDLLASYDVPGQLTAVEDLIAQGAEMQIVIRLLCLASIIAGGIKGKILENIKKEVLQVGYFLTLQPQYADGSSGLRV